jgi:hypothetical protein
MLYREIIAVCSHIYTKHINILCGQNVELFNVKLVIRTRIVTTECYNICPGIYFKCRALHFHSVGVCRNIAECLAKTSTCLS